MKQVLFLFVAACLIGGCGLTAQTEEAQISGMYHLLMFSTPSCEACKTVLPRMDMLVHTQLPAKQLAHLDMTGYIVTSADGFHAPDQPTADAYRTALNLSFTVLPDPWRWTTYGKYYGTDNLIVPGAVVIGPTGDWTKFDTGFTADRVFAYIEGIVH